MQALLALPACAWQAALSCWMVSGDWFCAASRLRRGGQAESGKEKHCTGGDGLFHAKFRNRPEVDARSRRLGSILDVECRGRGGDELGPHFDRDTSTGTDNAEVPIERHK